MIICVSEFGLFVQYLARYNEVQTIIEKRKDREITVLVSDQANRTTKEIRTYISSSDQNYRTTSMFWFVSNRLIAINCSLSSFREIYTG